MIRRCTINDLSAVNFVLKHPSVYESSAHDFSVPVSEFTAERLLNSPLVYVLMDEDNSFVAVLVNENGILFTVHQNCLPKVRGKKAVGICKEMLEWMFKNTTCQRIVGYVPEPNRPALLFAKWVGFKVRDKWENSYQKGGKLYSLIVVSAEK